MGPSTAGGSVHGRQWPHRAARSIAAQRPQRSLSLALSRSLSLSLALSRSLSLSLALSRSLSLSLSGSLPPLLPSLPLWRRRRRRRQRARTFLVEVHTQARVRGLMDHQSGVGECVLARPRGPRGRALQALHVTQEGQLALRRRRHKILGLEHCAVGQFERLPLLELSHAFGVHALRGEQRHHRRRVESSRPRSLSHHPTDGGHGVVELHARGTRGIRHTDAHTPPLITWGACAPSAAATCSRSISPGACALVRGRRR